MMTAFRCLQVKGGPSPGFAPHGRGDLRHGQGAHYPARARPLIAMETPMAQPNQSHGTGPQLRVMRSAKPLERQQLGNLLIRFPLAFQPYNLGFELAKSAQVSQAADGARHHQLTDGSSTPDKTDGNLIRRTPIEHHFVDQTPQQGLALGSTEQVVLPKRWQGLAQ